MVGKKINYLVPHCPISSLERQRRPVLRHVIALLPARIPEEVDLSLGKPDKELSMALCSYTRLRLY